MHKTVELYNLRVDCKLNLTADHWQLYNLEGRETERDQVAEKLNRAVESRLAVGNLAGLPDILYQYREWGASDTEGYATLEHILELCNVDWRAYV